MESLDLDTCKLRFERALADGDLDAADAVLEQLPNEARPAFDAWVQSQLPAADASFALDAKGLSADLALRGADADDAAMLASLMTGSKPASVLVAEAMQTAGVTAEQVGERLVQELSIGPEVVQAGSRIARAIANVVQGRDGQARRFAPDAIDALASVLGAPLDALRRAFEAASAAQPGMAGAFAREGHDGIVLPDSLAAEDDDIVDELFYRSEL